MKTQSQHHQIWQDHIRVWEKSGLSQKAYCNEHGIKLATFGLWRKRLRAPEQERISFIKTSPRVQEETPRNVVLQLVLPNGVRLGLNEDINESLLHQVLHFAGAL
jgi:transposase